MTSKLTFLQSVYTLKTGFTIGFFDRRMGSESLEKVPIFSLQKAYISRGGRVKAYLEKVYILTLFGTLPLVQKFICHKKKH